MAAARMRELVSEKRVLLLTLELLEESSGDDDLGTSEPPTV